MLSKWLDAFDLRHPAFSFQFSRFATADRSAWAQHLRPLVVAFNHVPCYCQQQQLSCHSLPLLPLCKAALLLNQQKLFASENCEKLQKCLNTSRNFVNCATTVHWILHMTLYQQLGEIVQALQSNILPSAVHMFWHASTVCLHLVKRIWKSTLTKWIDFAYADWRLICSACKHG